jgi:hypothetical protein
MYNLSTPSNGKTGGIVSTAQRWRRHQGLSRPKIGAHVGARKRSTRGPIHSQPPRPALSQIMPDAAVTRR